MTRVYKVTLMVVDHENIGEDETTLLLEQQNYLSASVISIEATHVDWTDTHPLNYRSRMHAAFAGLFHK